MSRGRLFSALLGSTLVVGSVTAESSAQTLCQDTDTFDACVNRLFSGKPVEPDELGLAAEASKADARSGALLRLYGKTAGLGGGIGGILGSAIEDFLPLFSGAVAIDREDPEDDVVAGFDLNLPAHRRPWKPFQPPNLGGKVRIRAEVREPRLFTPLIESVQSEERGAVQDRVERELDDLDDLSLALSWNRENQSFGRAYWANDELVDGLLNSIVDMIPSPTTSYFLEQWFERIKADVESAGKDDDPGCTDWDDFTIQMRCLTPGFRDEYETAIAELARQQREYKAIVDSSLAAAGFYRIADLINNQPQLNVSAETRLRDELVGPGEYRIQVRYENGLANLNGLRDFCGGAMAASCYRGYLDDPGVKATLRRSDRFWFSGEARWIEDYDFESAGPGSPPDLSLDGSSSVMAEIGYGRYLSVSEAGEELARIDVFAKTTLHLNESGRNDTWGISAIYTHRVSDSFSLPIGVSYSNRDEFLEDVDHRVTANMGLHYRLIPASP